MASVQIGLGGIFGDSDDTADTSAEFDADPLFDESQYTQRIDGTAGNDVLNATEGENAQAYFLGDGDDTLRATAGNDYINLGAGDDFTEALEGDDIVLGGDGDDRIFAGRGDDVVFGGAGNDLLEGSLGADTLNGGDGNDQLSGGRENDTLNGGAGDDILSGDRFDQISGTQRGVDILNGDAGNDTLWLVGDDTGTGGAGEDLFRVFDTENPDASVTITDYNSAEDRIEVIYEPEDGEEPPELTVFSPADSEDAVIALDGVQIATVTGAAGLESDDISLTTDMPNAA